jgi:hypothetical protein
MKMDSKKLCEILKQTTQVYRKGEEIEETQYGDVKVKEIFGYPHTSEAPQGNNYEKVDLIFVDVLVNKQKAETEQQELENILEQYPQPKRLAGGPSYIELAPNLRLEQEQALRLMAIGKTLGLWEIVSGKTFGMSEPETETLARQGLLMISGYETKNKQNQGGR